MTTPDKMFTLDPIKTAVTQPLQEVKAHQGSDSSVADAQFAKGLTAFGAAIGSLAEKKKQERIESDTALAKEAAIRNELMPGGLLPIAQEAFETTQDVLTANQNYGDIEVFANGDEVKSILNNSLLTPAQKNAQIGQAIDNLWSLSSVSIRNPEILTQFRTKVEGLKVESMKDVYNIDKNHRYGVSLNAVSSQVDNGFDDVTTKPIDRFTGDWVKTVVGELRTSLPWVSEDDAKLSVFSMLANNENMLENEDVMINLMQSEFSKGVTFSALANGSVRGSANSEVGKEIQTIYYRFLEKSERHFAKKDKEERDDENDRNELAMENGQKYLDSMNDPSSSDYPHRYKVLKRIMVDEQKGSIGTYNKMVRINTTLAEYTKNNYESKAHTDARIKISSGVIKTQREVIDYVHDNQLDNESRSLLISFLASDNKEYSKAIEQLKGQTNTVNGSLSSALRLKIAPNSGLLAMFDKLGPEEIKTRKIDISDILGGATVNPDELVDSMIELAELRDKLRVDMDAEVRAAMKEGRPIDSVSIVSSFHSQAQEFIKRIGESEKTEEVEKVEPDVVKEKPIKKVQNFTPKEKRQVIKITGLHPSEQSIIDFANVAMDAALTPNEKIIEYAKKFGKGVVSDLKQVFSSKESSK